MHGAAVIIVAAGRGERLAGAPGTGPKQYRLLGGRPMIAHAIEAFISHPAINLVLAVIHPDDLMLYNQSIGSISSSETRKMLPPANGGSTRQISVLAGLEALAKNQPQIVLIHDAARPFVTQALISGVLSAIGEKRGALPGHAISDTLKRTGADGIVLETISRAHLFCAETPQGFRYAEILEAHRNAANAGHSALTDDAAVAELAGMEMRMIESDGENMKITTARDLAQAGHRVAPPPMLPDVRTGNGYDVHPLVPGSSVTLCGVDIASDRSLKGHSDADVGLHALTDALLATIADGDIGSHFPPSDPKWKGMYSGVFLAHAAKLVRAAGGTITHLDVTLICETPKIAPHRDGMRAKIAEHAGIGMNRVSVKATTNEQIGFVGRREGIAAIATATAVFRPDGV